MENETASYISAFEKIFYKVCDMIQKNEKRGIRNDFVDTCSDDRLFY